MLAYIHPKCGKPAFMLTERPEYGSRAKSSAALHLNYSPVEYGSLIVCDSCGKSVEGPYSTNIKTMI